MCDVTQKKNDASFPSLHDTSPTLVASLDLASSSSVSSSSCQAVQVRHLRGRRYSSPALLSAAYEAPMIAPVPQLHLAMSKSQTFEPYTPRHTRRQARQSATVPLSLVFALCTSCAHSSPHLRLTPLLRCSSTRALPPPRAHHHRPSKSGRMSGEPRCGFASRRARDDTHDPDVPVRARPVLQSHPMPCTALDARPRDAHAPRVQR